MTRRYDAIVVGAGHNGLVCAAYLARAGLDVCVLERHGRVGGAAITEEFHPGFRNSMASYTVSLLQAKVVADLDLAGHGLSVVPRPLANFVPSLTGPGLKLPAGLAARQAAIAAHSRADAERYPRFAAELDRVVAAVRPLLLDAPVDVAAGRRAVGRNLRLLSRWPLPRPRLVRSIRRLVTGSAGALLDGWFETDALKGALGFDSIVGHFASPYAPGSAYLLLHHSLGELAGVAGAWGHAIGGMGAISDAIASAARAAGAEIRCEHPVTRIARAAGGYAVAAGGRTFAADRVVSAIHPRIFYLELLDGADVPAALRERIGAWRSESASLRINVALAELPDFACLPGRAAAEHHASGILIAPGLDYLDRAHRDALAGGCSAEPVVELTIPSTLDASLAPPGMHVASLFCQHFRRDLPDAMPWRDRKQAAVDAVLGTVDRYAPNFVRSIVAVQAYTPEDLERRFALVGGDIFHGVMSPDQLYWSRPARGYAQYRGPLEGLYMCGSSTHPGGGVSGAPGHNAAAAVLADRGRRRAATGRR